MSCPLFVAYCRGASEANQTMAAEDDFALLDAFSRTLRAVKRGEGNGNVH